MSNMTKLKGVPDSGDVRPGMAYYAGSGPAGKTCGLCRHRGYFDDSHDKRYGCAMFKKLTGRNGPPVRTFYSACKYYEALDDDPR